jgi:hypothetical protein
MFPYSKCCFALTTNHLLSPQLSVREIRNQRHSKRGSVSPQKFPWGPQRKGYLQMPELSFSQHRAVSRATQRTVVSATIVQKLGTLHSTHLRKTSQQQWPYGVATQFKESF